MIEAAEKVAIVGKAPSSRDLAPYTDESWEIWTLSDLVPLGQSPRFTRHFELHPFDWLSQRQDDYFKWLKGISDEPVYVRSEIEAEQLPAGVALPVDELTAKYGRYFTNTVSWMIATAIEAGPKEIGVWGVDMAQEPEYKAQRPSCEYFLGWARGAGIKVTIPAQSDLLKSARLYGIDTDGGETREKWKSRTAELDRRIIKQDDEAQQHALQAAFLRGARDSQEYYRQWMTQPWNLDL
jgi:hypothetical protein